MQKIANVVLIDDDEISNFLTATVIKNTGKANSIKIYQDGAEALDAIQEEQSMRGTCPELILLDLNMPNMNGYDFLEAYRDLKGCSENTVIIILSTSSHQQDLDRIKNFPEVEIYLNKPLDESGFDYIYDRYFSQTLLSE